MILVQDADLEYDPDDWPRVLDPLLKGKAQVVYGSRFTGERGVIRLTEWLGNQLPSIVTNILYNTTLSDIQTGYKVFDRRVLKLIDIEADGFQFEPEITAKIFRRGYAIYEVPISYTRRNYDEGKKFTWKDGLRSLRTLVRYRVHSSRTRADVRRCRSRTVSARERASVRLVLGRKLATATLRIGAIGERPRASR